jgi:hypothetical protein
MQQQVIIDKRLQELVNFVRIKSELGRPSSLSL